jgi:hypothetical protein
LPPARADAGEADGTAAATVITVVVAVVTCCGSVAAVAQREGAPVAAAVLPVTLGALDERSLMGTDASDLRALAGARGGTVGTTL